MPRILLITACWAAALVTVGSCKRQPASEVAAAAAPAQQAEDLPEPLKAVGWETYVGQGLGLWVRVDTQQLLVIQNGQVVRIYPCSTAIKGTGNQNGSEQTPLGWHEIGAKIGDGLAVGAILEERKWRGKIWQPGETSNADLVLSRVLRLRGLQKGYNLGGNVDSWYRYIYIHGTNDVESLGTPTSHGCVRLSPSDVIELFDSVAVGCRVLITGTDVAPAGT